MKKKIGEIYNIPIIIGDKNLKTKSEIHVDELSNVVGNGEGGGVEKNNLYCIIGVPASGSPIHSILRVKYSQLFKVTKNDGTKYIMTAGELYYNSTSGVTNPRIDENTPVMIPNMKIIKSNGTISTQREEFESMASSQNVPYVEITEEEFYNIS